MIDLRDASKVTVLIVVQFRVQYAEPAQDQYYHAVILPEFMVPCAPIHGVACPEVIVMKPEPMVLFLNKENIHDLDLGSHLVGYLADRQTHRRRHNLRTLLQTRLGRLQTRLDHHAPGRLFHLGLESYQGGLFA